MRYNLLIIVGFFILSCTESDVQFNSERLGYHYFPLEVGNYKVYHVLETKYTVLNATTDIYELKESVEDSFYTKSNDLKYVIHRSTRTNDTEPWHLDSVWTAERTGDIAVLTENNVSFTKLSFPIESGKSWDGNFLNSDLTQLYRYELESEDTTILDISYTNLVKVIQNDQGEDILGVRESSEIYAPNVGMIIKKIIELNYCQEECVEDKEIQSGREYKMTIKYYGEE